MTSDKPNFLSQPVVKNVFMFRNGDPYYEARRIVINEKRVCNFETLLREVTGGVQAPFGAVRNIYTPRGGHKVDCLDSLRSGEQYVAAGKERFKKLDYLQIGTRRKRMMQTLPVPAKPLPQNRIVASARFLKPIKEPCTIFVVANGDLLNTAARLLIHQRVLGQFDKILEVITEKMGLRVFGGVRSLYTYEGQQVTDGNQLEGGQLYVAVGREKFKKLPYSDLLFAKPRGTRRVRGMKAHSLPPIYRFSKQSGDNKSMAQRSESGDGESKASSLNHNGSSKENLSSIVREISKARLLSYRKRKSGQSFTMGTSDSDDPESKADEGNTGTTQEKDLKVEEGPDADLNANEDKSEKAAEKEESASENATDDASTSKEDNEESTGTKSEKVVEENKKVDELDGEKGAISVDEEKVEEVKGEETLGVTDGSKEGESEEQPGSAHSDRTQENEEKEDGSHASRKIENEQNNSEAKQGEDSSSREDNTNDHNNDMDAGKEQKLTEKSNDPDKTESNNDKKVSEDGISSNGNSNQEEDSGSREEQGNNVDTGKEQEETKKCSDSDKTQSNNETNETENGEHRISNSNQEEDRKESKEEATKEPGEKDGKESKEEDAI
ncbi:unnamed protein product, partial [Menidia menidia]